MPFCIMPMRVDNIYKRLPLRGKAVVDRDNLSYSICHLHGVDMEGGRGCLGISKKGYCKSE